MTIVYVILAIVLFGVLVAVHELGHFMAAKACGVKVDEFSVGMGPAIWKKQKGETQYSLRIVPIGGYCAMAGEDEESPDPRAFTNQAAWKRIIILAAGACMNFLLGLLIVLALYSNAGAFRAPVIVSFAEGCPYESEAGLQVGDKFYSIDGHRVYMQYNVTEFLERGSGVYDFVLIRDGKKVRLDDFTFVRVQLEGQSSKVYGINLGYEEATFAKKVEYSWNQTMEFGRMVWMGLQQLISGQVGVKDLSGPVGIVDLMAETGEQAESTSDALYDIVFLGAFIAVNLALMNMLPIPALDGGRIFLALVTWVIETVTGKRLNPKYEGYIHAAGMALLLLLMAVVMFNDIVRIFTK